MGKRWLQRTGLAVGCAVLGPAQAYNLTAAQTAAASNSSCQQVALLDHGFYWEVGNASGALVSGTQGASAPTATTPLYVDSSSKWLFGAYVLQKRGGLAGLQAGTNGGYANSDVAYLQMGNGYDSINNLTCTSSSTIASCYSNGASTQTASDIGKFYYSGGEFLAMANNNLGLGALSAAGLTSEIQRYLPGLSFSYVAPNPAASLQIDSSNYAQFLRDIITGALVMHDDLSADSWCTNPNTYGGLFGTQSQYCPTQSSTPPLPNKMAFLYGLAHWIESDPMSASDGGVPGDGAHSSPGATGFYPWIDATLSYYGIVAPATAESLIAVDELDYETTLLCGQAIRGAFMQQ